MINRKVQLCMKQSCDTNTTTGTGARRMAEVTASMWRRAMVHKFNSSQPDQGREYTATPGGTVAEKIVLKDQGIQGT